MYNTCISYICNYDTLYISIIIHYLLSYYYFILGQVSSKYKEKNYEF